MFTVVSTVVAISPPVSSLGQFFSGGADRTDTNKTWSTEQAVMIRFRCKDIDLKDCEFQVQGAPKEETLEIALRHLEKHHRVVNVTPETRERIQRAVKG